MKTIALLSNGDFPIPATRGGSVAVHIEYLINYNELHPKVRFIVVSNFNEEAKLKSRDYKFTKFIYINKKRIKFRLINGIRHEIDKIRRFFSQTNFEKGFIFESVRLLKKIPYKIDAILIKDKLNAAEYVKNKFPNIKIFSCAEWNYLNTAFYNQKPKQVESVFKNTDTFICVSNFIKQQIENIPIRKNYNCNIVTCYNGIKSKRFKETIGIQEKNELRKSLGFNSDDFVILFTGRLIPDKGILELIKAYLPVKNKAKLLILGNVDFSKLNKTAYISELLSISEECYDNIKFSGYVKYSEIHKYYKISNLVVLPSMCEDAFNLSLLEAMLSKIPTIITRSGGMPEVATDSGAIILDKDDSLVENLTGNILKIIDNKLEVSSMVDFSAKRAEDFTDEIYSKLMLKILSDS